jgi:uncharacterized membrane protein HdeD (DUF308 family)
MVITPSKTGVMEMLQDIASNWWVLLIRGIAAIAFGIAAFSWPGITLAVLVILYGVYALLDGVAAIGFGVANHSTHQSWWEMIFVGALGIIAGIVTLLWPGLTVVVLLAVIGIWAIVRGIVEIVAAVRLRKMIAHEWLLAAAGVLSITFGVIVLARPLIGALAIVWLTGFGALLFGVTAVALSLRLQRVNHRLHEEQPSEVLPV